MEEAVQFICNRKRLFGILHTPETVVNPSTVVIIVTGGPQVRTGAHRLYVQLSRFLCEHNCPSLRFDYEGMGDSEGDFVGFEHAEPSISAAIKFLQEKFEQPLNFIFWSLCDGATAAALYSANNSKQIIGMILCNPLVITDEGLARSTLRHYYCKRFFEKEFLHKLVRFELNLQDSFRSLVEFFKDAQFLKKNKAAGVNSVPQRLPALVIGCLHKFARPIRIILSTDDIVASNFQDELKKNRLLDMDYKKSKIINHFIEGADHTFIDPLAKEELFKVTLNAINEIRLLDSGNRC